MLLSRTMTCKRCSFCVFATAQKSNEKSLDRQAHRFEDLGELVSLGRGSRRGQVLRPTAATHRARSLDSQGSEAVIGRR
jgi:hypothetical protein